MSDFWNKAQKGDANECWPWLNFIDRGGYGVVRHLGRIMKAHRVAFLLANGFLPEAVCHTCDNRRCCNPAHLFAGTKTLNNADRHQKGRSRGPKGEYHPAHKLMTSDVVEIRRMIMQGMGNQEIAQKFNVNHTTISDVRRGKTWRSVKCSKTCN